MLAEASILRSWNGAPQQKLFWRSSGSHSGAADSRTGGRADVRAEDRDSRVETKTRHRVKFSPLG